MSHTLRNLYVVCVLVLVVAWALVTTFGLSWPTAILDSLAIRVAFSPYRPRDYDA